MYADFRCADALKSSQTVQRKCHTQADNHIEQQTGFTTFPLTPCIDADGGCFGIPNSGSDGLVRATANEGEIESI